MTARKKTFRNWRYPELTVGPFRLHFKRSQSEELEGKELVKKYSLVWPALFFDYDRIPILCIHGGFGEELQSVKLLFRTVDGYIFDKLSIDLSPRIPAATELMDEINSGDYETFEGKRPNLEDFNRPAKTEEEAMDDRERMEDGGKDKFNGAGAV